MADMLTARDLQALLQVDRSTIYRMAETGQLPAIKVGKQWRFPADRLQSWLATRTGTHEPSATGAAGMVATAAVDGHLSRLLPLDCVQLIQDVFAELVGVMLVVTDLEGNPVTQVSQPCGLFCAVAEVPDAVRTCIQSWQVLGSTLELEPKLLPSSLGLLCTRGLIRIGTELKGMVVMGGIAPDDWPPPPEEVRAMAAQHGVAPEALVAHLHEVYYLDAAQRTRLLALVQRIANVIAHIANERAVLMHRLAAIAQLTR
jgi:excisionase family DNA binding protein